MSDDLNIESLEYKSEVTEGDSTSATAGDSFRSVIECTEEDSMSVEQCFEPPDDGQDKSPPFLIRDRCWLCHCPRKQEDDSDSDDDDSVTKSRDGVLHKFLPWLCKSCERMVEEEERKTEPTPMTDVNPSSDVARSSTCTCESCLKARAAEVEKERLSQELEQVWSELSAVIRAIYHLDNNNSHAGTFDNDRLMHLVRRLCEHDADMLYQRLESQVREVVIEMKVRLLRELTVDHKVETRAHQFVSLLLSEYADLCASSQCATFIASFEEKHLKQFNVTWQLHNKHLFHSVIYSDPVVQNCMPKVLSHIRQSMSADDYSGGSQYDRTLADYIKFESEMSVVSAVWKDCKRLIEAYNEQQAALKLKQKMFKEDWEFFKAQRRLLEQTLPKSRQTDSNCHSRFDVHFNEMMMKILQGKKVDDTHCPRCSQTRCPCDECYISHIVTCGLISPEVSEQHHHHHHHHHHDGEQCQQPAELPEANDVSSSGDTVWQQVSPSRWPRPLSSVACSDSLHSYFVNIKPPSVPSSGSSSCSESPIILDRCRFFGENFDFANDPPPAADEDYSLFADVMKSHGDFATPPPHLEQDVNDTKVGDGVCDGESQLREVRPSSLVARMMMNSVDLSSDPSMCSCPHCQLNNGSLCMFEAARRRLAAPKPSVDHLQLSQLGTSRRLLNPQLYELHDAAPEALWDMLLGEEQMQEANSSVTADKLTSFEMANNDIVDRQQSPSDQEEIWSDCAAELYPCDDTKVSDDATKDSSVSENSACCTAHKNEDVGSTSKSAGTSAEFCEKIDASCQMMDSNDWTEMEVVTTSEPSQLIAVPAVTASCTSSAVFGSVSTTSTDKPTRAKLTPPPTTKATSATACASLLTTTTSSSKSERPRASPCWAAQDKQTPPPLTNSRESKPPCNKASAAAAANGSAKQSPLSNAAAAKLLADMVGRSKSTTPSPAGGGSGPCKLTQCTDKSHLADPISVSTEDSSCTSDKTSRSGTTGGNTDKKDGKFCECWHCEFFGHMSQSTSSLSRNYAETRDRLRARLQKRKERKKQAEASVTDCQSMAEVPSSVNHSMPPAGSTAPGSTPLNDQEVEEIIRFINGVDSTVTSSPLAGNAATKQKTKQKCRKGKDAASKLLAGDRTSPARVMKNVGTDTGSHGDSTLSHSAAFTAAQNKKTTGASPARHVTKVELVAELNSHLAKLTDMPTPTASLTTKTNGTDRQLLQSSATRAQSVPKVMSVSGDRDAAKQRSSMLTATAETGSSTTLNNHNGKNSSVSQQMQRVSQAASYKGKRQKHGAELQDLPVDDIFLPSDEAGRSESDDFDHEIEEFKRFCQTSCQTPKQERLRVALNLKDIFARNKSHQGWTT